MIETRNPYFTPELLRQASTFESYEPCTENQERAKAELVELVDLIAERAPTTSDLNTRGFKSGSLLVLSGTPGTGKSHLVEAFLNHLMDRRPDLIDAIFLAKEGFLEKEWGEINLQKIGGKAIVVIDDAFAQYNDIKKLDSYAVKAISTLLMTAYNSRRLCIINTNFPFLEGIAVQIKKHDETGRVMSRCASLLSTAGEFDMTGPDFRLIQAEIKRTTAPKKDLL